MARKKESQGGEIPPTPPAQAEPPKPEEKAFDPDCCTIEELHRHTTIHSPFLA
jgi:hypothetical protein